MRHPNECPCCYEMTYDFHYGAHEPDHRFGGSEPDEGYCSSCGFHYFEHIKLSTRDLVLMHRQELKEKKTKLDWDEIRKCDETAGYFRTEKETKINLRVNDKYPHHSKITVFVNGANCGDLCLRIEEFDVIRELLAMGIFHIPQFAELQISIGSG